VDRDNFLYRQLYEDLKKKIEDNIYTEGMKIPSDDELKQKFGVSMITVKKALSMLKEEGVLQRIPGVGTFVKLRNPVVEETYGTNVINNDKKIGVVMEHVSSSFGLDLVYKIDQKAEEHGYKVYTRFSYYNREKETQEIDFLVKSQIEGLIVMPCHGVYYNPKILKLILEGFPVVVIDKKLEGISVPSVRTDNLQAIKSLVKHLYEKGCRKLAFFSSEIIGTSSLQERKNGFYEAASEFGIITLPECTLVFDENIYQHPPKEENIERVVDYFRSNRGQLDGIVCAEYSLVSAIIEASRLENIKLDEEIKVSCVDGPQGLSLAHMKQNEIEMADKIVDLLLAQINKTSTETDFTVPALLVSES
jgi:DNA-binding LacI/PurR family transcriptional regulator